MELLPEAIKNAIFLRVYTGDTCENFRRCAVLKWGVVYYDKSKLPAPANPEIYLDRQMQFPMQRALIKAKELGHTPLVIEGKLPRLPYSLIEGRWVMLPPGYLLPVTQVWIPKNAHVWNEIDVHDDPRGILESVSSRHLLNQHPNP
jgi:hypothetical protein